MKKKFVNNTGLKILSVLVAFLIWLMVVNVDDPEQTKSYVITEQRIQRTNVEEAQGKAEQADKVYSVVRDENESGNVTIYVTARRSVLDKLLISDIQVEADMTNMTIQNTVPYEVTVPGVRRENIQCFPSAMQFKLEDKTEQTYAVSLSTKGQPASGYELGDVELREGDSVIIAGPTSVTRIIDKVGVQVDVSNLSENKVVPADIVVTDKNGNVLSKTQMDSLEIKTTNGALLKENTVNAIVSLWEVEKDIQLKVATDNIKLASGYHITSATVNPTTINLAGTKTALKKLEGELELKLENVPENLSESLEENIDLKEYLQENYKKKLKLETGSATAVSVKIQVEKVGTTSVNYPVAGIQIEGKPENMKLVLTPGDKITIEVNNESDQKEIQAEEIQVVLDLTKYQFEGNYTIPLQVTLPEGYSLENTPEIKVSFEKTESTSETTAEE